MTAHFVVACEDAGAAAALAPVASVLLARGDRLSWRLGPVAAQILQGQGLDAVATDEQSSGVLASADALLAGTTAWGTRLEAHAVIEARALGRPSLALIDFWSSYQARLSFPSTTALEAVADRLAVIDRTMHDDLVALGVAGERLVITGSPAFDALVARRDRWSPRGRRVLFLSQPIQALFGRELGYTETDILGAVATIVGETGAELVVRPHPREDVAQLTRLVASLACTARLETDRDLLDAIADARVVVGMTTMALVHAALAGAPALSVQLGRTGPDPLATNRDGLTTTVTDKDDLRDKLRAALDDVARPKPQLPAGWSPNATSRVVATLDALIAERR